jgi:Domain of unknown function (DUF4189)
MATRTRISVDMKRLYLFGLLLAGIAPLHAQTAGVDCIPIQNRDWSGCAPINDDGAQNPSGPQALPEVWVDHYGAIVSDDALGKFGAAVDKADEAGAWQAAEQDCHAKGGLDCTRLMSYRNQCVSMVVGEKTYMFSAGLTEAEAIRRATKRCLSGNTTCHVYYSGCSLAERIQ